MTRGASRTCDCGAWWQRHWRSAEWSPTGMHFRPAPWNRQAIAVWKTLPHPYADSMRRTPSSSDFGAASENDLKMKIKKAGHYSGLFQPTTPNCVEHQRSQYSRDWFFLMSPILVTPNNGTPTPLLRGFHHPDCVPSETGRGRSDSTTGKHVRPTGPN